MEIWYYICTLLFIIIIFLSGKIFIMNKTLKEIRYSLDRKLKHDTNFLVTISSNNKELKKLAKELNERLDILRKQEIEYLNEHQELKKSITNISHDLRTPLTAIKGYIDLIKEENIFNEKERKYFKVIENKINDVIDLTEQLFDYSKELDIYTSKKTEKVCINDILEEVICFYYELLKEKGITPIIEIENEKVIRELNKNTLIRIFENIISNAIKYSDGDLRIALTKNGEISFSNTATNLDKTTVGKIFSRYYTVENGKKAVGLGLSIAKQLVELLEGKIEAKYFKNKLIIVIKI